MSTSSMKNGFYHEFAVHQADDISLLGTCSKSLPAKYFIPVRGSKLLSPKNGEKGLKTLDSCLFASIFLKLRNTDRGYRSLTLFPSRMYLLPKRLRASA